MTKSRVRIRRAENMADRHDTSVASVPVDRRVAGRCVDSSDSLDCNRYPGPTHRLSHSTRTLALYVLRLPPQFRVGAHSAGDTMVDIRSEIDVLVRKFVDDLEDLVRRAALESVTQALEGGPAAAPPKPARPAKTKTAKKRATRRRAAPRSKAGKEQLARAMVDYLKANPGSKMEDIKVAVGEETRILRPIANKMLKNGHLRKEGEKRATRYYVGKGG